MLKNSKKVSDDNYLMSILNDNEKSKRKVSLVSFSKARSILQEIMNNFVYRDQLNSQIELGSVHEKLRPFVELNYDVLSEGVFLNQDDKKASKKQGYIEYDTLIRVMCLAINQEYMKKLQRFSSTLKIQNQRYKSQLFLHQFQEKIRNYFPMKSKRWILNAFQYVIDKCKGTHFNAHDVTCALIPVIFNSHLPQSAVAIKNNLANTSKKFSEKKDAKRNSKSLQRKKTIKLNKSPFNLLNQDIQNNEDSIGRQTSNSPSSCRSGRSSASDMLRGGGSMTSMYKTSNASQQIINNNTLNNSRMRYLNAIPFPVKDIIGKFELLKLTLSILTPFIKEIFNLIQKLSSAQNEFQKKKMESQLKGGLGQRQSLMPSSSEYADKAKQLKKSLSRQRSISYIESCFNVNMMNGSKSPGRLKQKMYSIQSTKLQISMKLKEIQKCCEDVRKLKQESETQKYRLENRTEEGWQGLRELLHILSVKAISVINEFNV